MAVDYTHLRIEGVYQQNEAGQLMLRVKVPAGLLSSQQALAVCDIADRYAQGRMHLTTRGSIELHDLVYEDLTHIYRQLSAVGLTSRGACGGAVRGVSCSTTSGDGYGVAQYLAAKLHRHFAGNPHFEGLPKKFKIAVEGGYEGARHLIQDLSLVYVGQDQEQACFDLWVAGGLGREPLGALRLKERLTADRVIAVVEEVVRFYAASAAKGKRLKQVRRDMGDGAFTETLSSRLENLGALGASDGYDKRLCLEGGGERVKATVFAGELSAEHLRDFAEIALACSHGYLALTADQDVVFVTPDDASADRARQALKEVGFGGEGLEQQVCFRVCPGSHECKMGLAPTRDVARQILARLGEAGRRLEWAISGCPNSCAQPQLAQAGILVSRLRKDEQGVRHPFFDLYRRSDEALGQAVARELSLEELLQQIGDLG